MTDHIITMNINYLMSEMFEYHICLDFRYKHVCSSLDMALKINI